MLSGPCPAVLGLSGPGPGPGHEDKISQTQNWVRNCCDESYSIYSQLKEHQIRVHVWNFETQHYLLHLG